MDTSVNLSDTLNSTFEAWDFTLQVGQLGNVYTLFKELLAFLYWSTLRFCLAYYSRTSLIRPSTFTGTTFYRALLLATQN